VTGKQRKELVIDSGGSHRVDLILGEFPPKNKGCSMKGSVRGGSRREVLLRIKNQPRRGGQAEILLKINERGGDLILGRKEG